MDTKKALAITCSIPTFLFYFGLHVCIVFLFNSFGVQNLRYGEK